MRKRDMSLQDAYVIRLEAIHANPMFQTTIDSIVAEVARKTYGASPEEMRVYGGYTGMIQNLIDDKIFENPHWEQGPTPDYPNWAPTVASALRMYSKAEIRLRAQEIKR